LMSKMELGVIIGTVPLISSRLSFEYAGVDQRFACFDEYLGIGPQKVSPILWDFLARVSYTAENR